jgi:hypothetical protein
MFTPKINKRKALSKKLQSENGNISERVIVNRTSYASFPISGTYQRTRGDRMRSSHLSQQVLRRSNDLAGYLKKSQEMKGKSIQDSEDLLRNPII